MAVQQSSLTVGLPVYNAMPFLPAAMEGLFSQTAGDFNILAIVDGGEDGSLEYLRSLRDKRLRVLHQPNQGLAATLNRMLREAKTGWLIRQDADDISYPTRIERLKEWIARYPEAGMFYSLAEYYPPKRSLGLYRCSRGSPHQLRQIVSSGYLLSICHPSAALNIEKTLAVGGYRSLPHAEDADLWWRVALQYSIHYVPEVLVGYRQSAASVSSRNPYIQELQGLYIQYLLVSHLSGRTPLSFSEVSPLLETQVSASRLKSKSYLRECNMRLAARRYGSALSLFLRSLLSSPAYLARRIADEYFPRGPIANGISPDFFFNRKEAFWT